ncbi:MAG: adenylyl-sulfate kinase [Deltaproteobacteria bacterium]|nr:MAG: adenylyl-sulfate kinase [Deltaproteobacteria bacterium]
MSFTLWFTGLSASGKTTLSRRIYFDLKSRGLKVELLDGDLVRAALNQDLGFSRRDRDIQVRRLGFISHLLNKNDVISIVGAISPYAGTRAKNRQLIEQYIEIFCSCPLEVVEGRDPKGLYAKARRGEILHFTGISDPYEAPEAPEIIAHTDQESEEASTAKIINFLEECDYIPRRDCCPIIDYSESDERQWRQRLANLGFIKS